MTSIEAADEIELISVVMLDNENKNDIPTEISQSKDDISQVSRSNTSSPGNGRCIISESGPDTRISPTKISPVGSDPLSRDSLQHKLAQDVSRLQSRLEDIRKSQLRAETPRRWSAEDDRGTEADDDDDRFLFIDDYARPELLHPDTLIPLPRLLHPDNLHPFIPRPSPTDVLQPALACPLAGVDLFFLACAAGARPPAAADSAAPAHAKLLLY